MKKRARSLFSIVAKRFLDFWQLFLFLMLVFALNRYAVASIQKEIEANSLALEELAQERACLLAEIEALQDLLQSSSTLKFQEMMLMQKLLILPDACEMFYWEESPEDSNIKN